jgi:hypothetical protein
MKLKNETIYSTRDLKRLFSRIASQELDPERAKRVTFKVIYSRKGRRFVENDSYGSGHNGWAYVNGTFGVIRLPKPPTPINKRALAMVIAHEMGHLRGLHHGAAMNCPRYSWRHDYRTFYAWADEYPVTIKEPRVAAPKAKNDVLAAKLCHTRTMLARNIAKQKRAATLVKKWTVKVRYYQKKVDTSNLTNQTNSGRTFLN